MGVRIMKIKEGVYPEEKDIDKWLTAPNLDCNIVFLWRVAAYVRDHIKSKSSTFARRTTAEQTLLYNLYLKSLKDPSIKANLAAKPGTSWHEFGLAIDFNRIRTVNGLGVYPGTLNADFVLWKNKKQNQTVLHKYGLSHSVSSEPWHIQPIETIGISNKTNFLDSDDYSKNQYEKEIIMLMRPLKNKNVGIWQASLKKLGYNLGTSGPNNDGVDDDFGPTTERVTKLFQKDSKLSETGRVDIHTYSAMLSRLSGISSSESNELETVKQKVRLLERNITFAKLELDKK